MNFLEHIFNEVIIMLSNRIDDRIDNHAIDGIGGLDQIVDRINEVIDARSYPIVRSKGSIKIESITIPQIR